MSDRTAPSCRLPICCINCSAELFRSHYEEPFTENRMVTRRDPCPDGRSARINRLGRGPSIVKLVGVEGSTLLVRGLDCLDDTPLLDIKPDPRQPKLVKVIEPEAVANRTGYAAPHTVHCGPEGIYLTALGAPDGGALVATQRREVERHRHFARAARNAEGFQGPGRHRAAAMPASP